MLKNNKLVSDQFLRDFFAELSLDDLQLMSDHPEDCSMPKGFSDAETEQMNRLSEIRSEVYALINKHLLNVKDDNGFPRTKLFREIYLDEEKPNIKMGRIVDIFREREIQSRMIEIKNTESC